MINFARAKLLVILSFVLLYYGILNARAQTVEAAIHFEVHLGPYVNQPGISVIADPSDINLVGIYNSPLSLYSDLLKNATNSQALIFEIPKEFHIWKCKEQKHQPQNDPQSPSFFTYQLCAIILSKIGNTTLVIAYTERNTTDKSETFNQTQFSVEMLKDTCRAQLLSHSDSVNVGQGQEISPSTKWVKSCGYITQR